MSSKTSTATSTSFLSSSALLYMTLLAVQFGLQPALTRRFTPQGITKSTVILCQEVMKFGFAYTMLYMSGKQKAAFKGWTISTWISVAGIPAALYAIQNLAALLAYQNLDALTFNVLNQTKTLSAALCCYLVMARKQSRLQIVALFLLLLSALVMERIVMVDWIMEISLSNEEDESTIDTTTKRMLDFESLWNYTSARHFTHGVAPILLASFISGLAGALSQKNLQSEGGGRNPYLFSMELCAASTLILGMSLIISPDGQHIRERGFWDGWTYVTVIPIVTNAIGGILVGLVTKHAGSVRKGFALIFGILLSGLIQAPDTGVSTEQVVGGALAAISLWMHATNPVRATAKDPTKRLKQE